MSSPGAAGAVGVIGGTGFYAFLDDPEQVSVTTPYGPPSADIAVGTVHGRVVAFVPRHGRSHEHPPHRVNYRANLWALSSLGVRQLLAPCAAGSLQPTVLPGTMVVPDQLVDRTSGRVQTFVERGAVHAPFADPYCPRLRAALVRSGAGAVDGFGDGVVDGGTMVVIEGPRFSTRAESRWYAAQGWSLVNMTGHPEAVLARELGLCYAAIALVTDLDAGLTADEAVNQAEVFATFAANTDRLKTLLLDTVAKLPTPEGCGCATWRVGLEVPFR